VSDDVPQFTAQEFKKYVERHQIKHVKTPVYLYHPQSNEQAEYSLKTFEQALKKNIRELVLAQFLLDYKNAIHATSKVYPAELFMGRKLRMRLDNVRKLNETTKDEEAVTLISKRKSFQERDDVIVRDYSTTDQNKWMQGNIIR
jgi:hypothetical protein